MASKSLLQFPVLFSQLHRFFLSVTCGVLPHNRSRLLWVALHKWALYVALKDIFEFILSDSSNIFMRELNAFGYCNLPSHGLELLFVLINEEQKFIQQMDFFLIVRDCLHLLQRPINSAAVEQGADLCDYALIYLTYS